MSKFLYFTLISVSFLLFACSGTKTVSEDMQEETTQTQAPRPGNMQTYIDQAMKKVELTGDQMAIYEEMKAKYRQKIRAARKEHQDDKGAMKTAMSALRVEQDKEINELLDQTQYKMFRKYLEEIKNARTPLGEGRGGL